MKRSVFLMLVLVLMIGPLAFGQNYWGAKLGINAGTFIGEDSDAVDFDAETKGARAGFVGGAFFDLRFSEMLGLRPELVFSGKGVKYEGEPDWDVKIKVRTIEVPILLQFFLPLPTDALDVSLFAGPAISYIFASKYEYSELDYDEEGDLEDYGIETTDVDFSVAFGSGVMIPAGPGELLIDLRYNLGVINILDETGDPEVRTGAFGASVGYGFPF